MYVHIKSEKSRNSAFRQGSIFQTSFLSLGPVNVWAWIILGWVILVGGVLSCALSCVLQHPWPLLNVSSNPLPVVTAKNDTRLCQMSPWGKNHPQLRNTALEKGSFFLCFVMVFKEHLLNQGICFLRLYSSLEPVGSFPWVMPHF